MKRDVESGGGERELVRDQRAQFAVEIDAAKKFDGAAGKSV